jgi:endonuclease/exonuclease/phosphatase family metal-dependent hydrolase
MQFVQQQRVSSPFRAARSGHRGAPPRSAPNYVRGVRALGVALCVLSGWSCDPFGVRFSDVQSAEYYQSTTVRTVAVPDRLRVMTYNIKFGGGRIDFFFDCHGDEVLMSKDQVIKHLTGLSEVIVDYDPHLLFLQEVDTNSKRSAFVNQVQWLLDHTELNYAYYASQWRADFVPSDGIGAVDSGNAILSKFPLDHGQRWALPLRSDVGGLTRYFYLRRNILTADVDVGFPLRVVATHAEAYGQDGTKRSHIDLFKEQLDAAPGKVIGGADLNTLPPGSNKVSDFDDSVCTDEDFEADDYSAEQTWLRDLYDDYAADVTLAEYQAQQSKYFSHTTDQAGFWNRKLDYLFTNLEVVEGSGLTHQDQAHGGIDTMPLSDHAPVSMEVRLP